MRQTQASGRTEARQGAARGDDSYLPARDRGPVRKLVRDVVDSRRNVGSFFLAIAAVALIGTVVPERRREELRQPAAVRLLPRDDRRLGRAEPPHQAQGRRALPEGRPVQTRGLAWYGISRSTMIRRWRFPKPDVALGADV